MSRRIRNLLLRGVSFLLAGLLLYLALNNVDLTSVWMALRTADYRWAVPAVMVAIGSHLLRAWRWQILLNTLPDSDAPDRNQASMRDSFSSLMIGYMVNYAAPRLGEVARSVNLSQRKQLSFSSVLGTVAVERVLDVAVLGGSMISVFVLLSDQMGTIYGLFFAPAVSYLTGTPAAWLITGVGVLTAALAAAAYYRYRSRSVNSSAQTIWNAHVAPLIDHFITGLRTLFRTGQPLQIAVSTLGMWFGYLLMAYLPLLMLNLTDPFDLSLIDTWSIMILGTLGILVPLPGGTGSYHYITIQTMVYLFAVDEAAAATYAVLTHAGQLLLYVTLGTGFLLVQGSPLRTMNKQSAEASSVN